MPDGEESRRDGEARFLVGPHDQGFSPVLVDPADSFSDLVTLHFT